MSLLGTAQNDSASSHRPMERIVIMFKFSPDIIDLVVLDKKSGDHQSHELHGCL